MESSDVQELISFRLDKTMGTFKFCCVIPMSKTLVKAMGTQGKHSCCTHSLVQFVLIRKKINVLFRHVDLMKLIISNPVE